ncbi:unnamed protein product [Arabis nemorensis]|uniref:Protein kinase domain-containing protein n=1 Tax=Arabis nemorensis TaxID=586526 RepID=A0A565BPR1_9BRAS|nr:unnamed protein product [Arabis nemorensis]
MDIRYEEPLCVDEISLKHVSVLGQGAYGSVSLKGHPRHGFYAKKTSPIELMENLKKELRIMLHFRNHPRIIQASSDQLYLGMLLKDCYIYMEYAFEGTLREIISAFQGKPLPEHVIGRSTRMILQGLEALHSHGYVHCDLKPSNVLLFPSTTLGDPWNVKLADFGLAKEPNTDSRSLFAGTIYYMPPESVGPDGVIGPALDIWSLGCIIYEMFGGKPIKIGDSYEWRLDQDISPVTKDFLRLCHTMHPLSRASATELLNHPFITQRNSIPRARPIPTRSPKRQQGLKFPLIFTRTICGPLPTPIGPTRRQHARSCVNGSKNSRSIKGGEE